MLKGKEDLKSISDAFGILLNNIGFKFCVGFPRNLSGDIAAYTFHGVEISRLDNNIKEVWNFFSDSSMYLLFNTFFTRVPSELDFVPISSGFIQNLEGCPSIIDVKMTLSNSVSYNISLPLAVASLIMGTLERGLASSASLFLSTIQVSDYSSLDKL